MYRIINCFVMRNIIRHGINRMEFKTNISVVFIYLFIQFHIQFTNHTYRINPPIRRFVYKTGAVFGPFPGRILLLLNYKTG